jgi:formylglycine-generating enzyme required for sulfatase activity
MTRLFCLTLIVAFASDFPIHAQAKKDPPKTFTNSIGMKFVWIPPGNFVMGSPKEEKERHPSEIQHKVTLTRGFYMGVYTVTQEEWQAVMGNNPSNIKGEKNLPVESVSWDNCQEFIKKLRTNDRKPYRLPTEAEWEYACRAGTTTPFHFGETISTDQANYKGDATYGDGKKGIDRKKPTPVGSFPANAWGLHDMHGNVWQWCQDWHGVYTQEDVVDPQGPKQGQIRVLRGGSWIYAPTHCRSAYRGWFEPGNRNGYCGLRVCFFVE